jgi:hypothetical protein
MTVTNHSTYILPLATPYSKNPQSLKLSCIWIVDRMRVGEGRSGEGGEGRGGEGRGDLILYNFRLKLPINPKSKIQNLKLSDTYSPKPLAFRCFSQLKLELKKNLLVYKYPNRYSLALRSASRLKSVVVTAASVTSILITLPLSISRW